LVSILLVFLNRISRKEFRMKGHIFSGRTGATVIVGALLVTALGCSQPLSTREKSTLAGGGLGAATGAVIGAMVGAPAAGAAIGGGLGAGAGALTGDQVQSRDQELAEQERQLAEQQAEIQRQRRELERERQRRSE
jgi:osmotically inducible lipoprotein OsmB